MKSNASLGVCLTFTYKWWYFSKLTPPYNPDAQF